MAWDDHDFDSDVANPWTDNVPEGEDPVWIDGNHGEWPVSKLEDSHLLNIERFLLGRGQSDPSVRTDLFEAGWYPIIRDEISRRKLDMFILEPAGPYPSLPQIERRTRSDWYNRSLDTDQVPPTGLAKIDWDGLL